MMLNLEAMLTGNVRRVSHVNRYSSYPVMRKENVAEHLYYAAFYSMLLARDIELHDDNIYVDYDKLLSSALVHDMEENIAGDLVRVVKYSSPEFTTAVQRLGECCVDSLSDEVGIPIKTLWSKAKDPSCIEGQIMALADFLTVVAYVVEELKVGNSYMHKIVLEIQDYLTTIIDGNHDCIRHEYLINCAKKSLNILLDCDASI